MAKKFKNSIRNKTYSEESSRFVCGNANEDLVARQGRNLTKLELEKLKSIENITKQKRAQYRETKALRNNTPPYIQYPDDELIYIPLVFHQFIKTGLTNLDSALNYISEAKQARMFREYDPATKEFTGLIHPSAFNHEFYQGVVDRLNGYMSGENNTINDNNYAGNAINNVDHGVSSKIRFFIANHLPVKYFTEYLTSRWDRTLTRPPSGWNDPYNLSSDSSVSDVVVATDHFELAYLKQGLNGRTSFNYTSSELEDISTAAADAYDQAFLVYDSLLSETMLSESLTQEEAIEFIANTPEAEEYARAQYIHQLKGLVSCGPSGAILTYDLAAYDVCTLVDLHSQSTGETVDCSELTECPPGGEFGSCFDYPTDFPFAYLTGVNPNEDDFIADIQDGRLGNMLPTLNVWTYGRKINDIGGNSPGWDGLGSVPTSGNDGNVWMSGAFGYSMDEYSQVLLHELGHAFGLPHTFQGGQVSRLSGKTSPPFNIEGIKELNLIEPSAEEAQYIKAIHKLANNLPDAGSAYEVPGGDISLKVNFPLLTQVIDQDDGSTIEIQVKDVENFEDHGMKGTNTNLLARKRILSHLLETGVFWANIDPKQGDKLVFNRVLDKIYSPNISTDFTYLLNGETPLDPLPVINVMNDVPPIPIDLNQLVLGTDINYINTNSEYNLVLFDSADAQFDNIKNTTFASTSATGTEITSRILRLYFFRYERDITFSITYGGATYDIIMDPTNIDEDGNPIYYYPNDSDNGIQVFEYTAVLPVDTEKITLKWYTTAVETTRQYGESKLVAVEFEHTYRPVEVLTRMPFCVLDSDGNPTDVFDEFWWINLNAIDENYPAYPDNWLTTKAYDEFDDDGNPLCPCLYATQYYSSPVGPTSNQYTEFTANFNIDPSKPGKNDWATFMSYFERDNRWDQLFTNYLINSDDTKNKIHYGNLPLVRYHQYGDNYGSLGHNPPFGLVGFHKFSNMPRAFEFSIEAVAEELNNEGIFIRYTNYDNLQPDIPRQHSRGKFAATSGHTDEIHTEFFNKIGVGSTNPNSEMYNPFRVSVLDQSLYDEVSYFAIDAKPGYYSGELQIPVSSNPASGHMHSGTPININFFYNAMDYTGDVYSFYDGSWGAVQSDNKFYNTDVGDDNDYVKKRRTLFSPGGILRIDTTAEVGLGKYGGITLFGQITKDLDIGENSIQGLIDNIESYIESVNPEYVAGCTDPEAENYNPDAAVNDSSCVYLGLDCDLGGPAYFAICSDSNITTCDPADQTILDTFLSPTDNISELQYGQPLGLDFNYPEPAEGCTGGGFKYLKNYPGGPYGNGACQYGILEAAGCGTPENLTQEELIALGPEYYTLVCPDTRYSITANRYTFGGLYYTRNGENYIGVYCSRDDGIIYAGTLNNPGERLYTLKDLEVKPLPPLESEAKNFNKIKTSIENICRFVNL